jgi:membrane-associated phospholipid phosphatase
LPNPRKIILAVSATKRLSLAVASALALWAVHAVAYRSPRAQAFDLQAVAQGSAQTISPRVHETTTRLFDTIDVSSLALFAALAVAVALARRRLDLAVAAVVLVGGANATTQVLKHSLRPRAGPFAQTFPSGHATVALSLGLALVLVVQRRARPVAALGAAGYAAAVGVSLVVLSAHAPSDVVGGYLVCGAWAGAAALLVRVDAGERAWPRGALAGAAAAGIVLVAVAAAVALATHPGLEFRIRVNRRLFEAAFGIAAVALAVAAATAYSLQGTPSSVHRGGE